MKITKLSFIGFLIVPFLFGCTNSSANKTMDGVSIKGFEIVDKTFLTKIDNKEDNFSFINKVNVP